MANNFTKSDTLSQNKLAASIPRFLVTRMGVIQDIPTDWTLDEIVDAIKFPSSFGFRIIMKARRLSRRHKATDPICPEHKRQKSIKMLMAEENLGYLEASKRFPPDLKRLPFHSKDNFYLTLKIKDKLRECHDANLQVVLAWIPSHSGITGNEVVDQCAKAAIHQSFASDQKCFTRDIRSSIRCLLFEKWNKLWQLSRRAKGQHYGNIQPNIPPKPWFFKHKGYSKVVTSNIIRLRLGHICSPVRLAKSRIRDSSICECGLDEGWMDTLPNTVYTSPTIFIILAVCYPTSTLAESSSPDGAIIHKN
ncbi:uncharacterized protein LOC134654649 [Cydia amplana]|uniref:uncharacterized protein LOC134654649 n=1 Tax=Cydia amplana TaxID=1869771 RepID=UPI002FE5D724